MGRGRDDRVRVLVTWELSLGALEAHGAGPARTLLQVLSCLDSAVPVPLLLDDGVLADACGGNRAGVRDCMEGL